MTPRPSSSTQTAPDGRAAAAQRLAHGLSALAPFDGRFDLRLRGVHAIRASHPSQEPVHATLAPALCLVAQGAKIVMLGREVFEYDATRMLALSVDLPIVGQVVRATPAEPYLSFRLELDPARIALLATKVFPGGVPDVPRGRGLYVGQVSEGLLDAAARLIELMKQPADAELLGPLVVDELLIRLLKSPIGGRVAQIGQRESGVQTIARAIGWLRANFAQPVTVDALARFVNMSVSSFHQHFKAVTSMSPLHYQKVLRLLEARRLMLSGTLDAAEACRRVGYLSPSQFSREYTRFFGNAPKRDVVRLREERQLASTAAL